MSCLHRRAARRSPLSFLQPRIPNFKVYTVKPHLALRTLNSILQLLSSPFCPTPDAFTGPSRFGKGVFGACCCRSEVSKVAWQREDRGTSEAPAQRLHQRHLLRQLLRGSVFFFGKLHCLLSVLCVEGFGTILGLVLRFLPREIASDTECLVQERFVVLDISMVEDISLRARLEFNYGRPGVLEWMHVATYLLFQQPYTLGHKAARCFLEGGTMWYPYSLYLCSGQR